MSEIDIELSIKLQQQLFVDPRRIHLLRAIEKCGSISQAAKQVGISYKTAWDNLNAMDLLSPKPLLQRSSGGKEGGGTTLTAYAKRVLRLYELLEQTQLRAFAILQDENIPLTSLLSATAKFSLQSSARNQLIGTVAAVRTQGLISEVRINIDGLPQPLTAEITQASAVRLQLQAQQELLLMFKAPWVTLHKQPQGLNSFKGKISALQQQQGNHEAVIQVTPQIECCASYHNNEQYQIGEEIYLSIAPEKIILLAL
ncbi:molybdate transport system regulatory protein [Pasteurella testudinis DSM 23072]|uniref:Molybdate transport system regulatory protein n=1 Tax=Pasteurella testudinis DSM 23072 TaxID=1122938 RepID=A0A1W1UCY2_9PAST|nr:TOBE domain-containing protein [Pasteurella testudinis]SMB78872.1 molybdate transport system regulatory protein [Pasteurella testudinis DSM 23072]SUB52472.1 transcriptional regulator ModE [Pasteurella testudinis]